MKSTISSAGIDIDVFKANATCSVSTSRPKQVSVPCIKILKRGSSKGANTFTKYYDKHIMNKDDLVDFHFVTPTVSKFKDDD